MPVIKNYSGAGYSLSYVVFGDLTKTETVTCRYMAVNTETLAFRIGGEYIGEVYVKKGDMVKKGDLLAELDLEALRDTMESARAGIDDLNRTMENTREQMALALETAARSDAVTGQNTVDSVRERYEATLSSLSDRLEIANMRYEEYSEQMDRSQLRAGIDGAVTYVRAVTDGQKSVEGETFISIADASNSVFSAETQNYELLPDGMPVEIYVNKEYLEAEVVSAEELGFEESFTKKGAKKLYFRLTAPNASLETGDRGILTLTLAEAKDTLYIPVKALHNVGDRYFVYQADETGLKVMTDVVPDLENGKYVEILSGLEEGENVIFG